MKQEIINTIKSLKLKGFNDEEIYNALSGKHNISKKTIRQVEVPKDISETSEELYTEMQKDLSRLISSELKKEKRDSSVILNAIKLQADLQEKKLSLKRKKGVERISKDYIYERDKKIYEMHKEKPIVEIAKHFNISELSVKHAIDRFKLGVPDELKELSPTVISETIGLPKEKRLDILKQARKNNWKRKDVREIVNKIKNEGR